MLAKRTLLYRLLTLLVVMQMAVPAPALARVGPAGEPPAPSSSGLYRTTVTLRGPRDLARLKELGAVVLEERAADQQKNADQAADQSASSRKSAVILADEDQLEALARLRFEPRDTDELGALVAAHAQAKPWLAAAWAEVQRSRRAGEMASPQLLRSLAPELKAALAALTSVDDADGLTNTQGHRSAPTHSGCFLHPVVIK